MRTIRKFPRKKKTLKRGIPVSRVIPDILIMKVIQIYVTSESRLIFNKKCKVLIKSILSEKDKIKNTNTKSHITKKTLRVDYVKKCNDIYDGFKEGLDAKQRGGSGYLERLTSKGDQPITGNDFAKTLEDITSVMESMKYIDDTRGVKDGLTLLNYFQGNDWDLKNYIKYNILPKYFSLFPLYVNVPGLINKVNDLPTIVSLYYADQKIKQESSGMNPEDIAKPGFVSNLANSINTAQSKFYRAKSMTSLNTLLTGL